jgi:hypothetical protein
MQATKVNPIQIQKYLQHVDYPCTKEELIEKAKAEGADDAIVETLQAVPETKFNKPTDVSRAIGQIQ